MATVLKLTEQLTKESGNKEAAFFRSSPVLDIKNLSISLRGGNRQEERILVKS